MIIDSHIHFTPPELCDRLAQFSEQEPYWGLLLNPPQGKSIQGWASPERMIADMDRAGVDKVVIVGEYFYQHESCVQRNDQAIELVRRYPDRVIALSTIQPQAGQAARDEFQRCLDNGLLGLGELNPYAQGHGLTDPDFLSLVEMCVANNVPLNLHVSEEIGGYYLGKSTTPLRHYYDLACRFPELKLILAHWGGGLLFYEMMPRVRKQLRNVYYDTAASPLLYTTKRIFNSALAAVDHRKILFGTDYPLLIYPGKMTEPDFQPLMDAIRKLDLDPAVYADIMGHNAAKVFDPSIAPNAVTIATPVASSEIDGFMPVQLLAETYPETQQVLADYGIPWQDQIVPNWEPLVQAAVSKGLGPNGQQELLDKLKERVEKTE